MPNILKRFTYPGAGAYEFPSALDLKVDDTGRRTRSIRQDMASAMAEETVWEPEPELEAEPEIEAEAEPEEEKTPIDFAQIQAEAILADARAEAAAYEAQAREALEAELDEIRAAARDEGYSQGYAEGVYAASQEAKAQQHRMAIQWTKEIQMFMEESVRLRDKVLEDYREELKELALTIAEKIIRISLRGSSDIIRRMVESATDKRKRCEWAQIYIADCDVRGNTNAVPELTAALNHIAERVRVIPMADDEAGTCIVEMPDEILDASVSTQLGNLRNFMENVPLDSDGSGG